MKDLIMSLIVIGFKIETIMEMLDINEYDMEPLLEEILTECEGKKLEIVTQTFKSGLINEFEININ
jgi:hypothetical protein